MVAVCAPVPHHLSRTGWWGKKTFQVDNMKTTRSKDSKPTGFIAASRLTPVAREDSKIRFPKEETSCRAVRPTPTPVMEMFEPFIHEGSVSLSSDLSDTVAVQILRDTGASQFLLLSETLHFSENSSTGASVLIKGANSLEYSPVPLHTVYLSSDLVSDLVNVGLGSSLPFEGVQLLLGNDLAGDKVVINSIVTDVPCVEQLPDQVEREISNLHPPRAVTRAMSKKKLSDEDKDVDIADTFISQVFEEAVPKNLSGTKSLEDDDDEGRMLN